MRAIKIKMKCGCDYSDSVLEIDSIYLVGCKEEGFYKKENIHDFLIKNPNSVQVNIYPYPLLEPVISSNGEKYVRSIPNSNERDNLLSLPRE